MSRVYDFYRTPDQSEIEEQEIKEYQEWVQEQESNNEQQKEDGK